MELNSDIAARQQLAQTGVEYYQLFVNALSFTLAVTAIDNYVTSDSNELITLAFTLTIVSALILVVESQISARYVSIKDPSLLNMLQGPVGLLSYLLKTTSRVLVHFLSTTVGRWVMTLTPANVRLGDTVTAVAVSMSMIWFLGCSIGLITLPRHA